MDQQLEQQLSRFIRVGQVSAVDPAAHKARVTFMEDNNDTSAWLPVLVPNTFKNKDYCLPDVGDDVLCLFLPCGSEDGFIAGSFYAGEVTPPENDSDIRKTEYEDGTIISYNRKTHELDAVIEGTKIHADRQDVNITTPNSVTINTMTVNINAGTAINLTSSGAISINGAGAVTINGASLSLN